MNKEYGNDLTLLLSRAGADAATVCRLLDGYGTLERLLTADPRRLLTCDGLSECQTLLLRLLPALTGRRTTDAFAFGKRQPSEKIREYLVGRFYGEPVEKILLLSVDASGRVLACDELAAGTVNASQAVPRAILDAAQYRGAASVILAHNHPLGNTDPSPTDRQATSSIADVLRSAGIGFIAHYIVAGLHCDAVSLSSEKAHESNAFLVAADRRKQK